MAAMISTLPEDMDLHETIDFLFSPAAEAIVPWQIEEEFRELIQLVANMRPKVMLEIGTADGGSLFAHARAAATDAFLVSIDLPDGPFGGGYPAWRVPLYQSFALPSQHVELMRADSHDLTTEQELVRLLNGRRIEYAFIDGDHTYDGVRQDFELCRRLAGPDAVIAFHDIAQNPNSLYTAEAGPDAHAPWAVCDFWNEVKGDFKHAEIVRSPDQEGYGIGVLYLGERP